MAKKLQNLENKLGSWTDQAALTRTQAEAPATTAPTLAPPPHATYPVARSLMDRIATVAAQHGMSQQAVVGDLLTWALDQVESGAHSLPGVARTETATP
jgi:hypothetical protein